MGSRDERAATREDHRLLGREYGVEQTELTEPWTAVEQAHALPVLVAPAARRVLAFDHFDYGRTFDVDSTVAEALEHSFDALVLPGGVANPDQLRLCPEAVRFVRSFFDDGKPIAAICHAPWMLIDAGVVRGRTLTSWPSLKVDLTNAGAEWVDEPVHVDTGAPSLLVTSRKPADLSAFVEQMLAVFSN